MKVLNGHGRGKATLDAHIEHQRIRPKLVEIRAHFARSEALKCFFDAKSPSDFYFEELLNSFIALAQYPLNFAIFKKDESGTFVRVAHFCKDKKHEKAFEDELNDFEFCDDPEHGQNVFRLFPDLLKCPSHFLAIFHMHTHDNSFSFNLVPASSSVFPFYEEQDPEFLAEPGWIKDAETYIASCADYFFQFKWDAFTSAFADRGSQYLITSLHRLSENQIDWSNRTRHLNDRLELVTVPQGRSGATEWREKLASTFEMVLFNATHGINLVTKMMRKGSLPKEEATKASDTDSPPNMFMAFRVFSRDSGEFRHDLQSSGTGYLYDTSFLIPHTLEDRFIATLESVKQAGMAASTDDEEVFVENFEGSDKRKRLFRNVLNGDPNAKADPATLRIMDDKFWQILKTDEGPKECVRILSTWVGDKCRSLVDPVYHTGLVHTNHLFKNGGLDRLGMLKDFRASTFEDIPQDCHDDVLRVVVFYYVLSEVLGWAPEGQAFEPNKLAAILVPIKMRGSVWGVTIHGAYTPDYKTIFADERYWQAYFKLTTDLKHKNSQIFDRYMWSLAEEVVEELFLEHYLPEGKPDPDLDDAVYEINSALDNTETTSPFAFPRIRLSREAGQENNYVRVVPESDIEYWVSWEIEDNQLFLAHQPWDKRATRKFRQVIYHGIMRAINKAAQAGD